MKKVAFGIAPCLMLVLAGLSSSLGRASEKVWSDDAVPAGAAELAGIGESWNWVSVNPAPYSGGRAHQSALSSGLHEHFFNYAADRAAVGQGDTLFAYVYLDPVHTPTEIMLSWNAGNWEHRAYWGADRIGYGQKGSASRRSMGPLPAAGQWVRLEVPAAAVGLAGANLGGMAFSTYDGRATYDNEGVASVDAVASADEPVGKVWVGSSLPYGAAPLNGANEGWNWISANPASDAGFHLHQSILAPGLHEHFFNYAAATITPGITDVLYTYVYLDPAHPPTEIMLSWNADNWEHRAYWGANRIDYGKDRSTGRQYMGPLPATGQWVRLEVPASRVGLVGTPLIGMGFSTFDGRSTWDRSGVAPSNAASFAGN